MASRIDVTPLLRRYERLKDTRQLWEPTWRDLADYVLPRRERPGSISTPGQKRTDLLYDATAINANSILAANLHGALTSPALIWFSLGAADKRLMASSDVRYWIEAATRFLWSWLGHSNFHAEVHEVYLDLGCFGTGCLFCEEVAPRGRFQGFRFKALTVGEYVIAEDASGRVNVVVREMELSPRQAAEYFGEEYLHDDMRRKLNTTHQDDLYPFLHFALPREQVEGRIATKLPVASIYIDQQHKHVCKEGGYREFPYAVVRWSKASRETYGRSVGLEALPDIKTLNEAKKMGLKAFAKALDPAVLAKYDGIVGPIRTGAGGITWARADMNDLRFIDQKSRFDVEAIKEEELRKSIKAIFFSDILQLPTGPPVPHMTVPEVTARLEQMYRVLGPAVGRIEGELLEPSVDRPYAILQRRGLLEPMPEELRKAAMELQYEGPLSRAQRSQDVTAAERWVASSLPLVQVDQGILDVMNLEALVRGTGEAGGVPLDYINSEAIVAKKRQMRAEAEAMAQQAQMAAGAAESLGKVAPFVKATQPGAPS